MHYTISIFINYTYILSDDELLRNHGSTRDILPDDVLNKYIY